ncbi:MAG TPA: hypothetical protein DD725_03530 [Deltaproteobacteria bacterium]|nr:hypothetical protein [Deltaproteobacteria bacterium]
MTKISENWKPIIGVFLMILCSSVLPQKIEGSQLILWSSWIIFFLYISKLSFISTGNTPLGRAILGAASGLIALFNIFNSIYNRDKISWIHLYLVLLIVGAIFILIDGIKKYESTEA